MSIENNSNEHEPNKNQPKKWKLYVVAGSVALLATVGLSFAFGAPKNSTTIPTPVPAVIPFKTLPPSSSQTPEVTSTASPTATANASASPSATANSTASPAPSRSTNSNTNGSSSVDSFWRGFPGNFKNKIDTASANEDCDGLDYLMSSVKSYGNDTVSNSAVEAYINAAMDEANCSV